MNEMHVSSELSAYIDQELAPAEQARVSTHVDGCGRCAEQLADLRATASLMAALPALRPSRSLVPTLTPRWNWLRPMRSFSAVTSGAFLMVFLIASVAQSGSNLGGGGALTPFGNAQPAAAPAAAPAETMADRAGASREVPELTVATAPPGAGGPTPATDTQPSATSTGGPTEGPQRNFSPSVEEVATTEATDAADAALARAMERNAAHRQQEPPSPLIWLGFALIAATVAVAAHWKLRVT